MRLAEQIATEDLPKKWGFVPRLRSGSEDRERLNQIVELSRGPKFAPRALMVLAEISRLKTVKMKKPLMHWKDWSILSRALSRRKSIFYARQYSQKFVSGPSYDQGSTLQALHYFEDYLILFEEVPQRGADETQEHFQKRKEEALKRKKLALREEMKCEKV